MANLSLLTGALEVLENPGIETLDPRFQEIASLAQDKKYSEVGPKIEDLFGENIYDIRVIVFYLYWAFEEMEMKGLGEIIKALNLSLLDNWPALGPAKKKEKQAEKSIGWFFSSLLEALQYHETKQDDSWQKWMKQNTTAYLEEILESLKQCRKNLGASMEKAPEKALDNLLKLNQWLSDYQRIIYEREAKEAPPEEPEEGSEKTTDQQAPREKSTAFSGDSDLSSVEGSYHLQQLMRKLKAFEILLQRGEIPKASLVANDLVGIIANFDPTLYFPQLFGGYFSLLNKHIEAISQFWTNKETLHWQVMEKLYRVDLDSFIDF